MKDMAFSWTRPKVHKSSFEHREIDPFGLSLWFESFVRMNDGAGAGSRQERRRGPGIERILGQLRWRAPSSERCGCGWPLASEQLPLERSKRGGCQCVVRSVLDRRHCWLERSLSVKTHSSMHLPRLICSAPACLLGPPRA
jgi:hypothetical protein